MKKTIFCIELVLLFQILNSNTIINAYQVNKYEKHLNSRNVTWGIDSLKKVVKDLQSSVKILQSESKTLDSINKNKTITINQNKNSILELKGIYQKQKANSIHGAIILLLGLFLEITGAVFVSSENLLKETLKVRPFMTEYMVGEEWLHKDRDIKINSLQVFGTYLLILGFTLQFIGTLLVVSNNPILNVIVIFIASGTVTYLSYLIIKKIGGLNPINKISTLLLNLKGISVFLKEEKLNKKNILICEGCFKKIKVNMAYIGYFLSNPIPRDFFLGHEACVEKEFEAIAKTRSIDLSNKIEKLDNFYEARLRWTMKHRKMIIISILVFSDLFFL